MRKSILWGCLGRFGALHVARWRARQVLALVAVLTVMLAGAAHAQPTAFPTLPNGTTACAGARSLILPAQPTAVKMRLVVWDGICCTGIESFTVYENVGSGYQKTPASQVLAAALNATTLQSVSSNTKWKYLDFTLPSSAVGKTFRIVNTNNVFHLGIFAAPNPPDDLYTYLPPETPLSTNIVLQEERYVGSNKVFQPITNIVGGVKQVEVCAGSGLRLSAAIDSKDRYSYEWRPGDGIKSPFDSAVVEFEPFDYTPTPRIVKVLRTGVCELTNPSKPGAHVIWDSVRIVVKPPIQPKLTVPEAKGCAGRELYFKLENLKPGYHVQWFYIKNGVGNPVIPYPPVIPPAPLPSGIVKLWEETVTGNMAEYKANPVGTPVPPSALPVVPSFLYESEIPANLTGGEISHRLGVRVSDGDCYWEQYVTITVYPSVLKPNFDVPAGPICSPVLHHQYEDHNNINQPRRAKYLWEFDVTNELGVLSSSDMVLPAPQDYVWEDNATLTKTIKVRCTVTDASGNCKNSDEKTFVLKTGIKPAITVEVDPNSGCLPVKINYRSNDPASYIQSYQWDLLQKTGGTFTSVASSTTAAGQFAGVPLDPSKETRVRLRVLNQNSCPGSSEAALRIKPNAKLGSLAATVVNPCSPEFKVKIEGLNLSGADSCVWSIGDPLALGTYQLHEMGKMNITDVHKETTITFENYAPNPYQKYVHLELRRGLDCGVRDSILVTVPSYMKAVMEVDEPEKCPGNAAGERLIHVVDKSIAPTTATRTWLIDGVAATPEPGSSHPNYYFKLTNPSTTISKQQTIKLSLTDNPPAPTPPAPPTPPACPSSTEVALTTYPRVDPQFTAEYGTPPTIWNVGVELCADQETTLRATGAEKYEWISYVTALPGETPAIQGEGAQITGKFTNETAANIAHHVVLTGSNSKGCTGKAERDFILKPGIRAAFKAKPLDSCTPYKLQLISETKSALAPNIIENWNLDGGVPSPDPLDPPGTYVYTTPGTHTVTLTAQNNVPGNSCDAVAPMSFTFEVLPPISVNVTGVSPSTMVCAPETLTFNCTASGAETLTWFFESPYVGDGQEFPVPPATASHTYQNTTDNEIRHIVKVIGKNRRGCGDKPGSVATQEVIILPQPQKKISFKELTLCSPVNVRFGSDAGMFEWSEWKFTPTGPHATTHGQQELRTLQVGRLATIPLKNDHDTDPIVYEVEFKAWKVWTFGGISKTCPFGPEKIDDKVTVPPLLKPLVVPSDTEVCSGTKVVFTDNTTGGDVQQEWTFEDVQGGNLVTDRGTLVDYTFVNTSRTAKEFDVKLRSLQTNYGCVKESHYPILVMPRIQADFKIKETDKCAYPYPITFTPTETGGEDPTQFSTQCDWDFGYVWPNPGGAQQQDVRSDFSAVSHNFRNHLPNATVSYQVKLNVKQTYLNSGKVCQHDTTQTVVIPPELRPVFDPVPERFCVPDEVEFTHASSGGIEHVVWDFGDGNKLDTVSTVLKVKHKYQNEAISVPTQYTVTLTAHRGKCDQKAERIITAYPKVKPEFTVEQSEFCSPTKMKIKNSTQNGKTFDWTITGVGLTPVTIPSTTTLDDVETPDLINTNSNSEIDITLRLLAKADYGGGLVCQNSKTADYKLLPPVKAQFTPSVTIGCNPLDVNITNLSTGLGSYSWYVDGAPMGIEAQPTFRFENTDKENPRTLVLRLEAKNRLYDSKKPVAACWDAQDVSLTVHPKLDSIFELDKQDGCSPLTVEPKVSFPSSAYGYSWDFSGGTPATSSAEVPGAIVFQNVTNAPPVLVKRKIKLTTFVAAATQCSKVYEREVTVFPRAYPDFSITANGCSPLQAVVHDQSVLRDGEGTYEWELNNGLKSSEQNPVFTLVNNSYTTDVSYTVKLRLRSKDECVDSTTQSVTVYPRPKAAFVVVGDSEKCPPFDVELQNQSEGTGLTHTFDFGDGASQTTTTLAPITHRYDNHTSDKVGYTINLVVVNNHNCTDTTSRTVVVFPTVVADFDFDPSVPRCSPSVVNMVNRSTGGFKYEWDFGDGTTIDMPEPTHTFVNKEAADKTFSVTLNVASEFDCKATVTKQLTVFATPLAYFEAAPPLQVFPNSTVQLRNLTEPQPDTWSYYWDFNDGYDSHDKSPADHKYRRWAPKDWDFAYTVKLVVNAPNCSDTAIQKVYIYAPLPNTKFTANRFEDCVPMRVFFRNDSEGATDYLWEFGDGTTSTDQEPIHDYTRPGIYHVKLTATGDGGINYAYGVFIAYERPVAKFKMFPSKVMLPNALVKAQNETVGVNKFWWDFGDGAVSTEEAPVHEYQAPGEYRVSLKVENSAGCTDTTSRSPGVIVLPVGKIRFPDVFQPNENGSNGGSYDEHDVKNQVFHPYTDGISVYTLQIYSRWGELIFESHDVAKGWDGYRSGKLCDAGVYTYRAFGQFFNGEVFDVRGNVTLLR